TRCHGQLLAVWRERTDDRAVLHFLGKPPLFPRGCIPDPYTAAKASENSTTVRGEGQKTDGYWVLGAEYATSFPGSNIPDCHFVNAQGCLFMPRADGDQCVPLRGKGHRAHRTSTALTLESLEQPPCRRVPDFRFTVCLWPTVSFHAHSCRD